MKYYINKASRILWSIIEFILFLLIWPTIVLLSGGVAIFFNVSVNVALEIIVGIILSLIGLYAICNTRILFEKNKKIPKIFSIIFGWLGPISIISIGISLILS